MEHDGDQREDEDVGSLDPSTRLLRELRQLVHKEAEEARLQVVRDWQKPLEQRLEEGICIADALCQHRGDGWIEVHAPGQRSRFREGDLVRVGFGNPLTERAITAFVEEENGDELLLYAGTREQSERKAELQALPGMRVLDVGHMDLSGEMLTGLQKVADTWHGREVVLPLLVGALRPKVDAARAQKALLWGEDANLNWSQCEALAQGYAADPCALIQGPPGTGKTRVLAELAGRLAQEGQRVLITSLTHRAIDNALNAVHRRWGVQVACAKIGGNESPDRKVPTYVSWKLSPFARLDRGSVLGATPFAASGTRLDGAEFDVVLLDEASQLTVPMACMAMVRAPRFVFFGDHRQLPPVLHTVHGEALPMSSIFGHLAGRGLEVMLNETWRLSPALAAWPSRHFYGGELEASEDGNQGGFAWERKPTRHAHILDAAFPRVFCRVSHVRARRRSETEAVVVASLVDELLRMGVPPREIAVIAPFRAQGREIREHLDRLFPDRRMRKELVVDTVERMQGQERDVVIVSLTASDAVWAARLAEFYFQPERLNVSITRARHKLILVGSPEILEAFPSDPRLRQSVALLRSLLEESHTVDFAKDDHGADPS